MRHRLLQPAGPQAKAAAAGGVGLRDALGRLDQHAAGRKIRARDMANKLVGGAGRVLDQMEQCRTQFGGIVRRDAGRHADCDAGGAIGQQVREAAGQHHRLAVLAVIGRPEIDRILVDAVEHRLRHRRQPAFGVAHCRGIIAVDVAEIALAVDQRIALREILRQADKRVIDRQFAVRVKFADHVPDDAGALLVARSRIEPQLPHRMQDAPMHRLQPVADIGQGARHDRRERIGEIALTQRVGEIDVADFARKIGHSHGSSTSKRRFICACYQPAPGVAGDRRGAIEHQAGCKSAVAAHGAAGNGRSVRGRALYRRCRPSHRATKTPAEQRAYRDRASPHPAIRRGRSEARHRRGRRSTRSRRSR